MKVLEVFGVVFLGLLCVLPLISVVSAGEFDFELTEPDANVTQFNEEVPTNWQYFGERQVEVGSTHYVSSLGQLVSSLDAGVIYTSTVDGNLLLSVNSINEGSCNLFAEVSGITYELNSVETKVLPVVVGQEFALKFTQTSYGNRCAVSFDLNAQWVE